MKQRRVLLDIGIACLCAAWSGAELYAQSCLPAGTKMSDVTSRAVRLVEQLPPSGVSLASVNGMKSDVVVLRDATACFAKKATADKDQCSAQVKMTFDTIAQLENEETALNTTLGNLQTELARAETNQQQVRRTLEQLQTQIADSRAQIDARRRELASYDWVKWICLPCKLIAEAITNDEAKLRRLESQLADLARQAQPLQQSLPALNEVVTRTSDALVDVRNRTHSIQAAQDALDQNISILKTIIANLNDAYVFWSKLSDMGRVQIGPDLDRLGRESRQWLSSETVPASFSGTGTAPTSMKVRDSVMEFARAIDGGHSLTRAADPRVCQAGSKAMQDLATTVLGPTTFGRREVTSSCAMQITSLTLENPSSLPMRCDIEGKTDTTEHSIVYLAPRESVKFSGSDAIGGSLMGSRSNRWSGRLRISCGYDSEHDPVYGGGGDNAPQPPPEIRQQMSNLSANGSVLYRTACGR